MRRACMPVRHVLPMPACMLAAQQPPPCWLGALMLNVLCTTNGMYSTYALLQD